MYSTINQAIGRHFRFNQESTKYEGRECRISWVQNLTEGKKYFSAILMHTVQNKVLYMYAKQRYEYGVN